MICVPGKVKRGRMGLEKLMRPTYWLQLSVGLITVPVTGRVVDAAAEKTATTESMRKTILFMNYSMVFCYSLCKITKIMINFAPKAIKKQ